MQSTGGLEERGCGELCEGNLCSVYRRGNFRQNSRNDYLEPEIKAEVKLVYQSIEGLHNAIPNHPGDWYFSGNYPTPGGNKMVNQAFINWYEGNPDKR